ncbi:hypothetical protein MMC17_004509 [Xylographa soralifera]|nr:hypothetical protein [Xylographa soralifera]
MYLPRDLISHLYNHLIRSQHAQSPPVLLLVALEPDALCACRILTALLKRDYIQHNIVPVSGYGDLARAGETQVQPMRTQNGGSGGTVICLGVGGLVDLGAVLGLEATEEDEDATGGVEIWVIDARRPWNLGNVFGGKPPEMALGEVNGNARTKAPDVKFGQIQRHYKPGRGGIIVYDDGDINEELGIEKEAYFQLDQLPPIDDHGRDSDGSDTESDSDGGVALDDGRASKKRKSLSDAEDDEETDGEDVRPRQRRRSNSDESISITPTRPPRRGLLSTSNNGVNSRTSGSRSRSSSPTSQPPLPAHDDQKTTRRNRRRLLRLKRKYEAVLHSYYSLGASYSEPISSLLYSLAGEIGREDNNFLWHAIVGVSSLELYGRSMTGVGISTTLDAGGSAGWGGERGEQIRQVLRDEVRRLNPPDPTDARGEAARGETSGVIPTTARSPTDTSIRLSPEPRFLLIRHWSLYDSMLHSPYLASRLHLWSDPGRKRLHKLLAKMGVSLVQSRQSYTHMDMDLKKGLRQRLLKYAPMYGLNGLVPPPASAGRGREGWGFVRSWGFKACLSAVDVGVIVGAILEVGKAGAHFASSSGTNGWDGRRAEKKELVDEDGKLESEEYIERFWTAYDALENVEALKHALPHAQHLHRAILRTGSALLAKRHIRHLKAFRMAVVKDGPDVALFTHPGALTKLALWLADAIAAQEPDAPASGKATPLVLAGLNDPRGVYVVVGTGGGGGVVDWHGRRESAERRALAAERRAERAARRAAAAVDDTDEDAGEGEEEEEAASEEEEEEEDEGRGHGRNRFGNAFQEVVEETGARVRIDSFEHCVVEVRKEDLSAFLEGLSMKAVVG